MGEVVNLRMARKHKARVEKEQVADQNRTLHGLTKAERTLARAKREHEIARIEAHRRERTDQSDES